jgi:hypothetical protein
MWHRPEMNSRGLQNVRFTPEKLTLREGPLLAQKRTSTKYPSLRVDGPAHWRRGGWQPIAVWSALQALRAGARLAVKSDSKNRANGQWQ